MRALSVRQPSAEAILRGVKKIEYRPGPTRVRGRVLIYAGLGRYSAADEAEMMAQYGIRGVDCDDLPRGVLVGSRSRCSSFPFDETPRAVCLS
jgi:hypothetical protein